MPPCPEDTEGEVARAAAPEGVNSGGGAPGLPGVKRGGSIPEAALTGIALAAAKAEVEPAGPQLALGDDAARCPCCSCLLPGLMSVEEVEGREPCRLDASWAMDTPLAESPTPATCMAGGGCSAGVGQVAMSPCGIMACMRM